MIPQTIHHPTVSICIANYNGEDLLCDCIDSVLSQVGDTDIEILVHDDASHDGSVALLNTEYPQVRVIHSATNVGFCIANNRMAAQARGEYILLLNNDAALMPDAISILTALSKHTHNAIFTLPQYAWDKDHLINRGCHLDVFYNINPIVQESTQNRTAMAEGACLFMERALWNRLDGFPEVFGSIAEDALLCCSARLAGASIICANASGYRHRQGASFGGNRIHGSTLISRYKRRYLSERNRIALLVSCTPTWLVWPWLAVHLLQLLVEAGIFCMLSSNLEYWRRIYAPALSHAWIQRQSTLRLRRTIQTRRQISLLEYMKAFTLVPQRLKLLFRHGIPKIND